MYAIRSYYGSGLRPFRLPGSGGKTAYRVRPAALCDRPAHALDAVVSRADAIARAERYFDGGEYFADLERRVAIPTESQNRNNFV